MDPAESGSIFFRRKKPVMKQLIKIAAAAIIGASIGPFTASAQLIPITDMSPGEIVFTPPSAGLFQLEWSAGPGLPYSSDWSNFSKINSTGAATPVDVPMCYRVAEVPLDFPLPDAVTQADFADGGNFNAAKVELGKMLFHDKILSGNKNISCAACHSIIAGTGDGLSLSVGEGGQGFGWTRNTGIGVDAIDHRVPRNAPAVFNLNASEFTHVFHDGRIVADPSEPSGFTTPGGADLPMGLDNEWAAQAMFPVQSGAEMAGGATENPIGAFAAAGDLPSLWAALGARLQAEPNYLPLFQAAYPGVVNTAGDIDYVQAANAMAEYQIATFRAIETPFDQFLRGDSSALNNSQRRGLELFYGKANCASCHNGKFLTDNLFHNIAMPQIGPGKGDGSDGHDDFGRFRVTGLPQDMYRFRTPPLRNVVLTAPYGHDGAFSDLRKMIEHHLTPLSSLVGYNLAANADMPSRPDLDLIDDVVSTDLPRAIVPYATIDIAPVSLSTAEVDDLVAFMHSLTDPNHLDNRRDAPTSVPSGLTVVD